MFSDGVETRVIINWPKNGPVPVRPVNDYRRGANRT